MTEHAVTGLVVDLARGALDRLEDDVLVITGSHALGQPQAVLIERGEPLARDAGLLFHPPRQTVRRDQAEGGHQLAPAQAESLDLEARLAVVAEVARERDQLRMLGDKDAALSGRDRLGRVERPETGVAPAARLAAVPVGSVRVRAVLDQEDVVGTTPIGD